MENDSNKRMQIATDFAVWAIMCAGLAGMLIAVLHTLFFSYHPSRSGLLYTLFGDAVTALGLAAGQGAVALVTGSILARLGRPLGRTVLLGLLVGAFDFVMYFLQMAVPATELGWVGDLLILVAATVGITLYGALSASTALA